MASLTEPAPDSTPVGVQTRRDPRGSRWAYRAGATGTAANALLVGFFAAIPTAGQSNPLGPANDIVGSVSAACMIPAAVAVGRWLPSRGPLRGLHRATLVAVGYLTATGPLLVSAVLPFPVATAASAVAFGVLVSWVGLGSGWLGRHHGLPRSTVRLGQGCAWAALAGASVAAASLVAPGSLNGALLGAAVAAGGASWLGVPVWWLLVGRWLDQPQQPARPRP